MRRAREFIKPLARKLTIFFGLFALVTLSAWVFLSVHDTAFDYETRRNFLFVGRYGFWGLILFAICLSLSGWAAPLKRFKRAFKRIAIGFVVLLAAFIVFMLEENIRGKITLRNYRHQLRAQGEKLTLTELHLSPPGNESRAVAMLLTLTNDFANLQQESSFDPVLGVMIKLVDNGRAIVRHRQPDLGVNRRDTGTWTNVPVARGRGRLHLEKEGETNATSFVPAKAGWADLNLQVTRASNVLDQIKAALDEKGQSQRIDYSKGFEVVTPHINAIHRASRWLAFAGLNALRQQNPEAGTQNILALARLSHFGEEERVLISHICRWQTGRTGLALTWEALQSDGFADDQLRVLQNAWQQSSIIETSPAILELERLSFLRCFVQFRNLCTLSALRSNLFTGGCGSSAPLSLSEVIEYTSNNANALAWRLAWLDQDELRFLRRYQLLLDRARIAVARQDWSALGLSDKDFPYAANFYDRRRFPLSNVFTPHLELFLRRGFEFEAQREMTIAAIAIKRYQLSTGNPPPDLASLVPAHLHQLPHDWFDGKPLRYRAKPDGTFTLYSVGIDARDDGGDPTPVRFKRPNLIWDERDAVWPVPE